ncbi:repressed By RIM101 protein 1-like [Pyrus ussuriensis x Pyrus communis]|uniref:Repressed By RIM101 protein 1-like n=1 Tax=Pyrus ussuriensis x Pyrus communis TaxID=2448454 RepID=A0A5N5FYG4_9ROSA|nr:repressed By RIM101 protein 1-like [Pyrus ussuriensis x Pyrus communis]
MDMKKITIAIIVVAALMSVVLEAKKDKHGAHSPKGSPAPAPAPAPSREKDSAPAPTPSSTDSITLSVAGSLAGVFLSSFFGYYLQY